MRGSWKGTWYGALALVALCLLVALPGLVTLPVVDRDEARFAQASRQMLEALSLPPDQRDPALHAGGWAVPMLGDTPRLNKPPLIYWLQSASTWLLSGADPAQDAIWMYRMPSVIALILIVLITWRLGMEMFGWPTGFLAACMISVSPLFAWEAHQARADMVLVAITCVAMWGLWGAWRSALREDAHARVARGGSGGERRRHVAPARVMALWIGMALGILVKGPVTPMIVILAAMMLSFYVRSWRWMRRTRPIIGVGLVIVLVLPWVWTVGSHVGWVQYARIVFDETLGRSAGAKEGHWGPPGYHLVLLVVLFWPGSMLTGLGFIEALRRGLPRRQERMRSPADHDTVEQRGVRPARGTGPLRTAWRTIADRRIGRPAYAFCIAWILPSWIVFELVSTKLPHYTMPLYPAVALVSARAVHWAISGALSGVSSRPQRIGLGAWSLYPIFITGAAIIAIGFMTAISAAREGDVPVPLPLDALQAVACLALLIVACIAAWQLLRLVRARRFLAAQRVGIACALTFVATLIGLILPRSQAMWATRGIEREIARVDPDRSAPIAVVGYDEDSLRFAFRGRPPRISLGEAPSWMAAHPGGLIFIPADADLARDLDHAMGRVSAFDYASGDPVDLILFRVPE